MVTEGLFELASQDHQKRPGSKESHGERRVKNIGSMGMTMPEFPCHKKRCEHKRTGRDPILWRLYCLDCREDMPASFQVLWDRCDTFHGFKGISEPDRIEPKNAAFSKL